MHTAIPARSEHGSPSEWALFGPVLRFLLVGSTLALLAGCGGDAESRESPGDEATEEAAALGSETARAPSSPAAEAPPAPPARAFPAGSSLIFEMTETVSTSSHEAGQTFGLRLVEEVRGTGGAVLPAGTRARGVIIESVPSDGPEREAVLAVRIQSVELNGSSRDIPGRVTSAQVESSARDSGTRSAAKVATGAAAGAVVGQILGRDTRSTVTGAAAGTAAGVGVALTTRGGHATLPEGARVTVTLDHVMALR